MRRILGNGDFVESVLKGIGKSADNGKPSIDVLPPTA